MINFLPLELHNTLFALNVYESSFPACERRDFTCMQPLMITKKEFSFSVIRDDTTNIGIFAYWLFEDFAYIEYFAMTERLRSRGYGSKVLQLFAQKVKQPIILEVEPPQTPQAQKRIKFYERCGFSVLSYQYEQPPYIKGGESVPMCLATDKPEYFTPQVIDDVIKIIHTNVYNFHISKPAR